MDALQVTRLCRGCTIMITRAAKTGRLTVIAGSAWMAGAAQFNLEAALAMGCGTLHAVVDPAIYPILQTACPHVVYHPSTLPEAELTASCCASPTPSRSAAAAIIWKIWKPCCKPYCAAPFR